MPQKQRTIRMMRSQTLAKTRKKTRVTRSRTRVKTRKKTRAMRTELALDLCSSHILKPKSGRAAAGKTITRGGLNDTEITEILDRNNISIDGSAKDRRALLTKLVDGSLKPGKAPEDSEEDSDDALSDSSEDSQEDEEIPSGLDYVEWGQAVGNLQRRNIARFDARRTSR